VGAGGYGSEMGSFEKGKDMFDVTFTRLGMLKELERSWVCWERGF